MKQVKIGALALAGAILASSCASSYQAASGATGAMIGSRVGEAIGFVSGRGHFRGHNAALGSIIGMGVGAALGVGIASHIEKNEHKGYDERRTSRTSDYSSSDYQTGGGAYSNGDYSDNSISATGHNGQLTISELTYMDADGDGYFSKGEVCEIEGFITNNTSTPIRDVVIYLNVSNSKDFFRSPSLTTTLLPGQRIRYTGRVSCKKARRGQNVFVNLNAQYGNTSTSSTNLAIEIR